MDDDLKSLMRRSMASPDIEQRAGQPVGLRIQGSSFDGSALESRLRELGRRCLPPYPSESQVRSVVVPTAPLLSPLLTYREAVERLVAWYRGAVESRFGKTSYAFTRGDITKAKQYRKLCGSVDLLSALEIPPASWVMFSFDVWIQAKITQGPPTILWTFSAGRMSSRMAWFERERGRYCGGRTYFAPEHLVLVRLWRSMWDALMVQAPERREDLVATVERFFPGDQFERLLAEAQRGSRRLQNIMDDAIENGRMVW